MKKVGDSSQKIQTAQISFAAFWLPGLAFMLLLVGLFGVPYALPAAIAIGIVKIVFDSYKEICGHKYSLDYIAFVAMLVSLLSRNYIAGAIVAIMFTGGKALEEFASRKAQAALKSLGENIPKKCFVYRDGAFAERPIQEIQNKEKILVKRNEVVPLDGTLLSKEGGVFNLANLTGEMEPVNFKERTLLKSGSINIGDTIELEVVGDFSSSTYHKIVKLVEEAHANPARIVRLSERANMYFTTLAFGFALVAYFASGELGRALAVLVIATPCPLIIAAPVAFIGGMSRLARKGVIVRKPSAFEGIDKATVVFFDKTGTLTMGAPRIEKIEITPGNKHAKTEEEALKIAAGIEIHSLHPLAKAIVGEAERRGVAYTVAEMTDERIGKGISGRVDGYTYSVKRVLGESAGIVLALISDNEEVARLYLSDELKEGASGLVHSLKGRSIRTEIITGDRKENAASVLKDISVTVHAESSPEHKYDLVKEARKNKEVVVMVGDGLNDAPALALADVGIVFSGTENGASIEAADVVVLGSDISKLAETFAASHRTLAIARQSIYGGIILSTIGMAFAAMGFVPPVAGAFIQEAIDSIVILNALRTIRG